jgi:hypothetical protein
VAKESGGSPTARAYNPNVARTALDVLDVSFDGLDRERVAGRFRVIPDGKGTALSLTIEGWAIGHGQRATEVEVLSAGQMVARAPINRKRPDIARQFPNASGAPTAGFHLTLEGEGKGESELLVRAALEDDGRAQVGTARVRARRRGLLRSRRRS